MSKHSHGTLSSVYTQMSFRTFQLLFFISFSLVVFADASVGRFSHHGIAAGHLRCEYKDDPLGIDVRVPRLSWLVESSQRYQYQSAYRILVASSPELLARDAGDLWDTSKVNSDASTHIVYEGIALASRQHVFWKVKLWNQADQASAWSEPAEWSMGLLEPSDWQADWIGYDAIPEHPIEQRSTIKVAKATYGIADRPEQQVDVSQKIAEFVSSGQFDFKVSNDLVEKDPARGRVKVLDLEYEINGEVRKRLIKENQPFSFLASKRPHLLNRTYLPSPHLRREFNVGELVERAMLYVTAEGVFEMRLNGQRVSDEYLMPGWTDYPTRLYYRSYDVTDLLENGPNALGGILGDGWFRGNISILGQNQYGKKLRLKAQLVIEYADGRVETISTDDSWKANFGPIRMSDMHAGETYDARLEMPGWDRANYDDSAWYSVDTGATLNPQSEAYPGVPVRPIEELEVVEISQPLTGVYVFDLGQNFAGWARLKVRGQKGDKIVMRFGEMLNPDGTVYTDNLRSAWATNTYILKGGAEEIYEPHFTFHGYRYVEVIGLPEPPTQNTITGIVVHSDAEMTSSFECSDPMLNQLHSNIVWGQRSNYFEVPTDCPQRDERLAWTGDVQIFMRSGTYHQDVAAYFTKWMVDLKDSQNEEGIYGQQAPVFHGFGSPGWSDAGIICPWTFYQVYGDTRMLQQHYEAMAEFLDAVGGRGLNGIAKGFGDHLSVGSSTPKDVISVAYYAYSASLMAEIAEALGKAKDAEKYRELFERIRGNFQDSFIDAEGKIKGHTQTAYSMALQFDLLTETQRAQAATHLVERVEAKDYHLSVGFLGVPLLLPALTEIGRSDLAYRLIQNRTYPSWGYSVEQGATTIWERWNSWTRKNGFGAVHMNSFNHYAYGSCSEWMFYSILGIDLDEVGYKTIRMKPEVGHGVTWAKGHYDSVLGRIASDWRLEEDSFRWSVTVPANTSATLYFPNLKYMGMTESDRSLSETPGVEFLGEEAGRKMLRVGSGHYDFVANLSE